MSGNIFFLLFLLICWAVLIFLNVKGKMRLASFLSLLRISCGPLILGLIFIYALPVDKIVNGATTPQIPFAIVCIIITLSIISLIFAKKENNSPSKKPSMLRWFLFVFGILIQLIGLTFVMISFYTPHIFGSDVAIPQVGVLSYFIFTFVSSLLLYLSSRMNSENYPNIFRWMVFWAIFLMFDQTTIISLILIYALPSQPPAIFPYLSGLNSISYLPHCLVILLLSRDYILLSNYKSDNPTITADAKSRAAE